ncbi:lipopolysaccharide biosynthesis protein [Longimicrobium sp.]|uniref:lipopolysaccharide biosynthesis protein n=1 Tax=Longimicrobium sp. TaxID=2029185 RepID=UPI002C07A917|nr:oligosaccharide flippase family protein [Longimicrobium sp.]HSU13287.1 oligosaccharide flippase family protein [Longimicrobium sp.]
MASELRTLGRHTLVYGAGEAVGRLASFIMLPVYTRFLAPADYGVLELMGTTIDVVGMIAGMGLAAGVFKEFARITDRGERDRMVSTVTLATGTLSLMTALLGLLAAPLLSRWVLAGAGAPVFVRVFFVIYFLQSLTGIPFLLVRAEERSLLYVWLNVGKLVASLSLNILFLVYLRMGVMGVLLGNVIVSGVLGVGMAAWTLRRVGFHFSPDAFRRLSRFGGPIVVWSLASFVLTFSDRYFLVHWADAATVGLYSLAYKFSFLLSAFAFTPFSQVWEPRRFIVAQRPDAQAVFGRVFFYLNACLGIGALGLVLFTRDVLAVMADPAYLPAAAVVPLLLGATVFQQWTAFCNLGLYLKEKTGLYARAGLVGVAAVTVLNFALIPRWGMWGAAWATLAAYAIRFAAVYVVAQRAYPIEYGWGRVSRLLGVVAAAAGVRMALPGVTGAPSFALSCGLLAAALIAVYAWTLSGEDRAMLRGFVRRPIAVLSPAA